MILQLFWFHVTSPRLHLLPILFFCNAKDYQRVKSILSSIKTVALVQLEFELKKGSHFCCCQNLSNQFCKIQKNARFKDFKFMDFCALYLILKNPQTTLFYFF